MKKSTLVKAMEKYAKELFGVIKVIGTSPAGIKINSSAGIYDLISMRGQVVLCQKKKQLRDCISVKSLLCRY